MNSELSCVRIIREHVDGEPHVALPKPDEPAPVFLIRLEVAVSRAERRQKLTENDVAANTAVVDVLLAISDRAPARAAS